MTTQQNWAKSLQLSSFFIQPFLEARVEILKEFVGFLGDLKRPKGHFEINWPLEIVLKLRSHGSSALIAFSLIIN